MSGSLLQIAPFPVYYGSEIILSILFMYTFERRLRIAQSAVISIIAFGVSNFVAVGIMFFLVYPYRDTTQFISISHWLGIVDAVGQLVIPAYLITWQAKKYGIVKVGKLGLGAKVCLSMFAVLVLLVIIGPIIAGWFA
jgi:hypothetical protein